jgi:hypothetical protein
MVETSTGVALWWATLSTVALFNISLWLRLGHKLSQERGTLSAEVHAYRRRQLLLAAGFVFGCAFRSFLPRADVQRIVLVDTWLSSVMVGRTVATVAELCFMAQAAFYLRTVARGVGSRLAGGLSRLIVPMIAFAETSSWTAVIKTHYVFNAIEESTWTAAAIVLFVGFAAVFPRTSGAVRRYVITALAVIPGYVAFMCTVDVPMYLGRWRADELAGKPYLSLGEGLCDLALRWTRTRSWDAWHTEMPWMGLYFSIAVWLSLSMMRAPLGAGSASEPTRG